jgi:hypothetical protein
MGVKWKRGGGKHIGIYINNNGLDFSNGGVMGEITRTHQKMTIYGGFCPL